MKMEFREASIEDTKLLIKIYNDSFYSDYIKYGECPGYGKTSEMMEKSIKNYPKFIILIDGKPVGVIACNEVQEKIYEMSCLCIIPKHQGLGIGTKAFRFVWSHYKDGAKFILVTPADKEENIRFYTEKCGFHIESSEMDGKVKVVQFVRER